MKLYQATQIIEAIYKSEVMMIEYEDGSKVKFNFKLNGDLKKRFINLKNIHYQQNAQNIINKF